MNLVSEALKLQVNQAMRDVFDTFAKEDPVTFYKMPSSEVVALDPNFNGYFQQINTLETVQNSIESQSFTCRVIYMERQDFSSFVEGGEDAGVNGKFLYNRIKLQCLEDGFQYLKDTERYTFLDEKYAMEEAWRRLGILGTTQCYQVILRRVI